MRRTQYGTKDKPRNTYQEVRDAILYKHVSTLQGFAETDPDTIRQIIKQEPQIDPIVIVDCCPQFLSDVQNAIVEDPKAQVPEVIIELVKKGGDKDILLAPFLTSCKLFSYRAVLEGLDVFDPEKLQEFVIAETIQEGNCKNLADFAKYTPTFDANKYINIFMDKKDIRGVFKLVDFGLIDVKMIDDQVFSKAESFKQFNIEDPNNTPELIEEHQIAMDNMFLMLEVIGDKAELDRIESMLIEKDADEYLHEFVGLFQDRQTIPDYLAVKEIMNS